MAYLCPSSLFLPLCLQQQTGQPSGLAMACRILQARAILHTLTWRPSPNTTRLHLFSTDQSHYRKQVCLFNILERYGFPPSKLQTFLCKNRYLSKSNVNDIEKCLSTLLLSFNIPQQSLVSLISDCPGVLELGFLKKWEAGLLESGNFGGYPLAIKSVLEHSKRFQIDPDRFVKSLRVLKGLGFSEFGISRVLEVSPGVMSMEKFEIQKKVEFLMRIGVDRDGVDWIVSSFPEVLGLGLENRLMPLLDEFEDLGYSKGLIRKEIVRKPQILGMEVGELSRFLELLQSLKCREPIKLEIFAHGTFRAGIEVKLRVDCLCKHGLIRREALKVLWKEPRVIIYDLRDIEKKIKFLLSTMGFSIGCLVEVPEYLGVNFDKQIVPRYNVIEYLRAKDALGDEVGLKGMIKLSRVRFYNMYVKPYPECEKIFGRFSGDTQCKSQHPTGLWKFFKAQNSFESKDEVKNMRSFMEGLGK